MARKLSPEELYKCCEKDLLKFKTTDDLKPVQGTIGQERAMHALDFGLSFGNMGFNIFVLGESGTGKLTTIKMLLHELASREPVPPDWCYVYNFKNPDVPNAISMEPGKGQEFQRDMEEFINSVKAEIPKVFESKEYERQSNKIMDDFQKKQRDLLAGLEAEAQEKGFLIKRTIAGLVMVPVKKSGEPLTEEEFEALDEKTKKKVEQIGRELQEKLDDVVREVRETEKSVKDALNKLEREGALWAVGHMVDDLKKKYASNKEIVDYLDHVREDILQNLEDFKSSPEKEQAAKALPFMRAQRPEPSFTRYTVNVLVNNAGLKGAPCVYESNPTYNNLMGRIEYKFQFGMATTDFSLIKAGSLHRANGGYFIVDALDLLRNVFSYEALKRAMKNREVKIEDIWEQYRAISTSMLRPEAIPLDVKVILIGNPYIYYLLYNMDEEYRELFKVKADFDSIMDRTEENVKKYVGFIAHKCTEEKLLPFERSGVEKIVEFSSRLAGQQDKLTARFSEVADLMRESHYWAQQARSAEVTLDHVEKALQEKIYRHNRIDERLRDMMLEDTLIVETAGAKTGQINGLVVLGMGDYMFGKPSRITARTYAGKAGVINIERETKMSGRIHEKAVLIITNFLWSKYAVRKPISLSASLTFEQLYEMIEGDSASCAELYAILSSIAEVPIKQSIAITGSMDQNGDVQPIGGVNEKIEGFFDLCKHRGLDGSHAVIIPTRNIKNLMLKKEVVDAVKEGKFSIYPIAQVDEGIEILMEMPAGQLGADGKYPEGTLNFRVMKRLAEISEAMKEKKEEAVAEAVHAHRGGDDENKVKT
jgi:lon-related putative ATP-dependent protease